MSDPSGLRPDKSISSCPFTSTKYNHGRQFPQAIAHRGYKAAYPENTMGAFAGAVSIGAHAIETDVHITKDNIVVLSHDATLKRCFGRPEKLLDVDWDFVSTLWTVDEPRQRMPRLFDLLHFLAKSENEHIWLVLDLKMDNDADNLMRLIAKTIASVPAALHKPWSQRIVLGCWAAKYIDLSTHYMPGFPITHIGFSLAYARQFLAVPNLSFNMLLPILIAPGGKKFIRECKKAKRPVLAWTVNAEDKMKWCIHHEIDGVLTDNPKLFLDVCRKYDGRQDESLGWRLWIDIIKVWILAFIFGALYRNRFTIKQRLR
ncbi:hypothetical protein AAFC00_004975 [Neodothiora populina]